MLDKVKLALRLSGTALDGEVSDLINAAIADLRLVGINIPAEAGSRAGNFVTLPSQEVDRNGNIQVPFAGIVRAAGRSPADVKAVRRQRS